MIISFSGCSGSGKSTIIKKLNLPYRVKKEDDFVFLKIVKKILGKKQVSRYVEDKKKRKYRSKIWAFFYAIFVYLEFLIEYIFYEVLFKNKIIIRDRYIVDYLVTLNKNLELESELINLLYKNFPNNSLSFYIDATKKDIIKRNKNDKSEGWTSDPKKFILEVLNYYKKLTKNNFCYINNQRDALYYIKLKTKLKNVKAISFSGVDGSGKTTLVKNFSKELEKIGFKTKIVHFYHDNIIFKLLKKIGILEKPREDNKYFKKTRKRTRLAKEKGKSLLWAVMHFTDSFVQYLFSRVLHPGKILIYDRYLYDYLVSFDYFGVSGFRIFKTVIPKLDLSFVVVIDPKVAAKRKPENNLEFFKFADKRYKKVARENELAIINANQKDEEKLVRYLVERIIK